MQTRTSDLTKEEKGIRSRKQSEYRRDTKQKKMKRR